MSSSSNYAKVGIAAAVAVTVLASYWWLNSGKEEETKASTNADTANLSLPVVDFSAFFEKESNPEKYRSECAKVAHSLHHFGLVILKDPRVAEADNLLT